MRPALLLMMLCLALSACATANKRRNTHLALVEVETAYTDYHDGFCVAHAMAIRYDVDIAIAALTTSLTNHHGSADRAFRLQLVENPAGAAASGVIGRQRATELHALPLLVTALADPDPEVRQTSAEEIVRLGKDALPALAAYQHDPSPERRARVAAILSRITAPRRSRNVAESFTAATEEYRATDIPDAYCIAYRLFDTYDADVAVQALLSLRSYHMGPEDQDFRRALARECAKAVMDFVQEPVSGGQPIIQLVVLPLLVQGLTDPVPKVRETSAEEIVRLGQDALPLLRRYMDKDDPLLRTALEKIVSRIQASTPTAPPK